MRAAWLMLLVVVPVVAQEYQVDLTGTTVSGSPFTASFDVNAGGALGVDPPDCQFGGILSVTNLSVTVAGQGPFFAPSLNGVVNAATTIPGRCAVMQESFGAGFGSTELNFELQARAPNLQFNNNLLIDVLTSWETAIPEGGDIGPDKDGIGNFKLTVQPVGVPEPPTLVLMVLGLIGVGAAGRRLGHDMTAGERHSG
jgi:hypothetical protein